MRDASEIKAEISRRNSSLNNYAFNTHDYSWTCGFIEGLRWVIEEENDE